MNLQESFKLEAIIWAEEKVRYLHRGVSKFGCDCTGLIIGIARSLGYLGAYKLRIYAPDWNKHTGAGDYIREELEKVANEIPKNETAPGDILVFKWGNCLAHVGILIDKNNGKFIHNFEESNGCCYAILKNSGYEKRWKTSYRLDPIKMEKFNG